ncbi:TetR/AcrR family transcriptional regulator [Mycolicibacterium brisbanense]
MGYGSGRAQRRRKPGRPVGADAAQTRARIVRAGREIITEYGYGAATFQAIARRTGLSRPTLNYYFADWDDLYGELVHEAHSVLVDCIEQAKQHELPVNRLRAFVTAVLEVGHRDSSFVAFLVSVRLEAERNPALPTATVTATRAFLFSVVGDAVARRDLPADTDATAIVELLHAILCGVGVWVGVDAPCDYVSVARQLDAVLDSGLLGGNSQAC